MYSIYILVCSSGLNFFKANCRGRFFDFVFNAQRVKVGTATHTHVIHLFHVHNLTQIQQHFSHVIHFTPNNIRFALLLYFSGRFCKKFHVASDETEILNRGCSLLLPWSKAVRNCNFCLAVACDEQVTLVTVLHQAGTQNFSFYPQIGTDQSSTPYKVSQVSRLKTQESRVKTQDSSHSTLPFIFLSTDFL